MIATALTIAAVALSPGAVAPAPCDGLAVDQPVGVGTLALRMDAHWNTQPVGAPETDQPADADALVFEPHGTGSPVVWDGVEVENRSASTVYVTNLYCNR
jgi:hypothetical protein